MIGSTTVPAPTGGNVVCSECGTVLSSPAPQLLPPVERIYNHAADQLIELLMDVAFNNLLEMCRDKTVAAAAKKFLAALVKARDRKPKRARR